MFVKFLFLTTENNLKFIVFPEHLSMKAHKQTLHFKKMNILLDSKYWMILFSL